MTYNVAILGASSNPSRYAWKAQRLLSEHGYPVFPVSISHAEVEGVPAFRTLTEIPETVDTVTLYLRPDNLESCLPDILTIKPRRVIFNPGSESPQAMKVLREQGIAVEAACTLVLLRTGQFDA